MNNICFKYMDKRKIENYLPKMFEVLYSNMSLIAPTNNSYEADFQIWVSHITSALHETYRETILLYADFEFVGYFRYSLNSGTQSFLMEDIQIKSEFQGAGLFSSCLRWLVNQLPENILCVEAYADKRNNRSRAIMEHLGLKCKGENKNGISLHYIGDYSKFYSKFR